MKTSRIVYDPMLSVEENAVNNNVTTAAIRSYIQINNIDRNKEKQLIIYNKVKEYANAHPGVKAPKIAKALSLSENTVRRYLKMTEPPKPKDKKSVTVRQEDKLQFLSVDESQTKILKSILRIHLRGKETFQCDLTAWKLGFYKDIPKPYYCYDKYASILKNKHIKELSEFEEIPDGYFGSIVIDLPCSVEMPSSKSRFDVSTHFSSLPELIEEHDKMISLAHRKMQTDGLLVYKVMDFTYCRSPYWLSDEVLRIAKETGFELADKYIYLDPKYKNIKPRRFRYIAAFPAHAYFFVFKKSPRH